ncbi:hypothetical protein FRC12_019528 [Ceratobasidium sp. 428]|nr:hypothetical protein FRC12_019528 [Ceratobasidium sp. 428]
MAPARVLHWFRTDLRVYDAPALHAGLDLKPEVLYPVWCWDPEYVFAHRVGVNRFNFLIESMNDLSQNLTKINKQSKLLVVRGSPYTILPALWKKWKITHLVYEIDTGGYAQERDRRVRELAAEAGIEVVTALGHSLYDPALILEKNGGKATTTITQWQKAAGKLGSVPRPFPTPKSIPSPGDLELGPMKRTDHPVDRPHDLNKAMRVGPVTCFDTFTGLKRDFAIPTLEELGLPAPTTSVHGGETLGRARLAAFNQDEKRKRAALFEKPKTSPAIPGPLCEPKRTNASRSDDDDEGSTEVDISKPSTTLLSPYLKFGCVGVRECWWSWSDILSNAPKSAKKPENLLGQLEFRDMYYAAELAVGGTKFGRVRGNPISKYIPWHCPTVYSEDGEPIIPRPKDSEHLHAEEWLAAWSEGRTGFPWIDALMRQLREEGWMHHLGRHSVACFLTRGQCYVSWERGAEVFDAEYLIDWDPASNYGNWMWLSCSAFQSQFLRVYGVASWPSKFDKTGALVRKYIPELKNFPDKVRNTLTLPTYVINGSTHSQLHYREGLSRTDARRKSREESELGTDESSVQGWTAWGCAGGSPRNGVEID